MIPFSIELVLLIVSMLLLLSILASKISDRFGIPALLLFLLVGMLAGSEGIGGIHFNDPWVATFIGIIALIFILFSGGMDTKWSDVKPVLWQGVILSTLGVLLTALFVAGLAMWLFGFDPKLALMLGAIVSSTDAASVLGILRSRGIRINNRLRTLLEFESGSNDPMAVFLTLGMIRVISEDNFDIASLIPQFFIEIIVGLVIAFLMSRVFLFIINNFRFAYDGLYPVITLAFVPLVYALTTLAKGNGFLAVYVTALILGKKDFLHKKSLMHFHDGIGWLMQIFMFLILGLLVFPSGMIPVINKGIALSVFLILVARPVSIFLCLTFTKIKLNEKLMLSWVGLRGAVPIILATFPLLAGIPDSEMIFNIVFFVVLSSIFIQGSTIPFMSRLLKIEGAPTPQPMFPIEFERKEGIDANLEEIIVPYHSAAVGKRLFEIGIPEDCLVVLLCRDGKFHIPNGASILEDGDVLQVLGKPTAVRELAAHLRSAA